MKKYSKLAAALAGLLGGLAIPGVVLAGAVVINDSMTRRPAGSVSGDGISTVEQGCEVLRVNADGDPEPAPDPDGNAWQGATADVMVRQVGEGSTVDINVKNAVPETVFTVWLRIKGGAGFNDGGSPLTGGGATPLAPGDALEGLNHYSPWVDPAGSSTPTNGFTTDANGNGHFSIDLDFPVVGGAYPFQEAVGERPGHEASPNVPTAIVDPRTGNGGPFLMRVISHCTDQVGHGLSPGTREAWFQYP